MAVIHLSSRKENAKEEVRDGGRGGGARSLIERREAEKMHLIFAASPNPLSTLRVCGLRRGLCVCGCAGVCVAQYMTNAGFTCWIAHPQLALRWAKRREGEGESGGK